MRHRLSVLACLLLALTFVPKTARAQEIDPAFRADIVKMIEVTGGAKLAHQMVSMFTQQFAASFKEQTPDAPSRVFEVAQQAIEQELEKSLDAPEGIIARLVPLYAKHFTPEDVPGLIAFYQSDLGQRLVAALPGLMQDSVQTGREWGTYLAPRVKAAVEERLKAEGLTPP